MSLFESVTSRIVPLCIFGGAAFYYVAVGRTLSGSEQGLLLALLGVFFIGLFSRKIYAHPAYAPGMLCLFLGLLFYESRQQDGPHAEGTILLGILLAVILLINFARFTRSPDL